MGNGSGGINNHNSKGACGVSHRSHEVSPAHRNHHTTQTSNSPEQLCPTKCPPNENMPSCRSCAGSPSFQGQACPMMPNYPRLLETTTCCLRLHPFRGLCYKLGSARKLNTSIFKTACARAGMLSCVVWAGIPLCINKDKQPNGCNHKLHDQDHRDDQNYRAGLALPPPPHATSPT